MASVSRCSSLNRALVRGASTVKISVFISSVFQLFTGSNVPFTFFPVALCAECSRRFHRLRFLTFGLFRWRGFFCVVGCLVFNSVLWCGWLSLVTESFANLKLVKIGEFACFSSSQLTF